MFAKEIPDLLGINGTTINVMFKDEIPPTIYVDGYTTDKIKREIPITEEIARNFAENYRNAKEQSLEEEKED